MCDICVLNKTKSFFTTFEKVAQDNFVASAKINHFKREIEAFKEENGRLREALEYYANPDSWRDILNKDLEHLPDNRISGGKFARLVLKKD